MIKVNRFSYKIIYLVSAALLLILSVFSLFTYQNMEKIILQREYESANNTITHLNYSVDEMNSIISQICLSIYMNDDVKELMENDQTGNLYEVFKKLERLDAFRVYNLFIDSILIYNGQSNITYNTQRLIFDGKNPFLEFEIDDIPKVMPIYRSVDLNNTNSLERYKNYFSYVNYEKDGDSIKKGIIININAKWLLGSVDNITKKNTNDNVFFIDKDRNILTEDKDLIDEYNKNLKQSENRLFEGDGYFTKNLFEEEYLVITSQMESTNWTVVMLLKMDHVLEQVRIMKKTLVFITLVFILFSLVAAVGLSKLIYRPVGKLVAIFGSKKDGNIEKNEFEYITTKIKDFQQEKEESKGKVYSYTMYHLLFDSTHINEDHEVVLKLDFSKPLMIIVFNIAGLGLDTDKNISTVQAKIQEIFESEALYETIQISSNKIVVIVNVGNKDIEDRILNQLRVTTNSVFNGDGIPLSVACSQSVNDLRRLTSAYNSTISSLRYSYIFGVPVVITKDLISQHEKNYFNDVRDIELEKRLEDSIVEGKTEHIDEILDSLLNKYCKININDFMFSLMLITSRVRSTMERINDSRIEPSSINFDNLTSLCQNTENMYEYKNKLREIICCFIRDENDSNIAKHKAVIQSIVSNIKMNYNDSNFTTKQIALEYGLSRSYAAKLFKDYMNVSITNYLNDVRMMKAAKLFTENPSVSVKDVMNKVGIDNESYFYRLFKKKYGVTPKEYAIKNAVNKY